MRRFALRRWQTFVFAFLMVLPSLSILPAFTSAAPASDASAADSTSATDSGVVHFMGNAIATDAFNRTWSRTDKPVADLSVSRTWMWGPQPNTGALQEDYKEAPGGKRTVQYFDKSRMEDNSWRQQDAPWDVTNGLLAEELITGKVQTGDDTYEQHSPAQVNVAGDTNDPNGPTYATFNPLMGYGAIPNGWVITQTVNRAGTVGDDQSLTSYTVKAQDVGAPTKHNVASVFWDFMNSSGLVYQNGGDTTQALFPNPFYATGYPLTEAYWTHVLVGGTSKLVLVQVFERRVLTYTPDNPDGWKVEAGNVGQHYYQWRYQSGSSIQTGTTIAQKVIDASAGGTVTAPNGVSVTIPAGALSQTTTITISDIASLPTTSQPVVTASLSKLFKIDAGGASLTGLASLTLPFDPSLLPPGNTTDEAFLSYYDEQTSSWVAIGGTIDTVSHTITVQTDHFSIWEAFSWDFDAFLGAIDDVFSLDVLGLVNKVDYLTSSCNDTHLPFWVDNSNDNHIIRGCILSASQDSAQIQITNAKLFDLALVCQGSSACGSDRSIAPFSTTTYTIPWPNPGDVVISVDFARLDLLRRTLVRIGLGLIPTGSEIASQPDAVAYIATQIAGAGYLNLNEMQEAIQARDVDRFKDAVLGVVTNQSFLESLYELAQQYLRDNPTQGLLGINQLLKTVSESRFASYAAALKEKLAEVAVREKLAAVIITMGDFIVNYLINNSTTVTIQEAPATPTEVRATPLDDHSIRVDWNETSTNVVGFDISDSSGKAVGQVESKTITVTGLGPNEQHCYVVEAYNSIGASPFSDPVCATTKQNVTTSPTNLHANPVSQTQIDLNWSYDGNDPDLWNIYVDGSVAGTLPGARRDAHVGNLQPNTNYCFFVTAVASGKESQPSNSDCATTQVQLTKPAAPSNLQVVYGGEIVGWELVWQDNSDNEDGFAIVGAYYGQGWNDIDRQVPANADSYVLSLTQSVYDCYDVAAFNSAGYSDWSEYACKPSSHAGQPAQVIVTPTNQTAIMGQTASITVMVLDTNGAPVSGVQVLVVNAAGPNQFSTVVTTGADGTAVVSYSAHQPSVDTIGFAVDSNQNGQLDEGDAHALATVDWTL